MSHAKINFDPLVQRRKSALMQRIQWDLETGYFFHFSGVVSPDRAMGLAQKFAERYGVNQSKSTRHRNKIAGKGSAKIYFFPLTDTKTFWWIVLLTDGDHPAREEEDVRDAREKRQRLTLWDQDYEAIRVPKRADPDSDVHADPQPKSTVNPKKATSWTWRMTEKTYEYWIDRVTSAARRKNDRDTAAAIHSLQKTIGFSGIREQTKKLKQIGIAEWERVHRKNQAELEKNPFKKTFIPYIRFVKNELFPLSVLCDRAEKNRISWYPAAAAVSTDEKEGNE